MRTTSCLLLLGLLVSPAAAELPSPRLDRIFPLGATAGSSVEIDIIGADIEDGKTLLFDHPGFKVTLVRDRRFKVNVGANVPPGTYDVRVVGRFGVSNPRLFGVTHGLT